MKNKDGGNQYGPIGISISGPSGASGKTRAQLLIARALTAAGYSVECKDSACGLNARKWEELIGRLYPNDMGRTEHCSVCVDVVSTVGEENAPKPITLLGVANAAWRKFRHLNAWITLAICSRKRDYSNNLPYCRLAPFAWVWMLLPVAGIVGFYLSLESAEDDYKAGLRG